MSHDSIIAGNETISLGAEGHPTLPDSLLFPKIFMSNNQIAGKGLCTKPLEKLAKLRCTCVVLFKIMCPVDTKSKFM